MEVRAVIDVIWRPLLFEAAVAFVGCQNPSGAGGESNESGADTTPPATVSALVATAGDQGVVLAWSDPPDADLSGAEITWIPDGENPQRVDRGAGTYTALGLVNGNEYTISVTAIDVAGNRSAAAEIAATPVAPDGDSDDEAD